MSEAVEHKAVAQYLDWRHVLWCHVPNEGKRNYQTAAVLRSLGLKRGVPDILIFEPRGGYHGLAIEMKDNGGKLTEPQKQWLRALIDRGYKAGVCYSAESAIKVIERYLDE